ncbi:hypothetical protein T484DRAFT_1756597 [Baffinella frigidus]|nr:hypothetical protein T484DRAFT_1756597 [Cryptophyta sp. CCMP2293]
MNRFTYEMCIAILAILCFLKQCEVHNLTRTVANQEKHAIDQERIILEVVNRLEETWDVLEETRDGNLLLRSSRAIDANCKDAIAASCKSTQPPLHEDMTPVDEYADEAARQREEVAGQRMEDAFRWEIGLASRADMSASDNDFYLSLFTPKGGIPKQRDVWAAIRGLQREVAKCTK